MTIGTQNLNVAACLCVAEGVRPESAQGNELATTRWLDPARMTLPIKDLVDLAIDDDPRAPFLWVPEEEWQAFCAAVDRRPNLIGAVIYRGKTVRAGGPFTDVTTRRARD